MHVTEGVVPRMARAVVERMAPFLPNRWSCHRLVKWSGAQASTIENLGNGMKAEVFFGDIIGCHIHYYGWYEEHVVQTILPFLRNDTIFVDVGANIGQYTLLSSPMVRQVVALEPNPAAFALLQRNVERNGLSNVLLFPMAASFCSGEATIVDADPANHGSASIRAEGAGAKIKTCALDSVLDGAIAGGRDFFLKVDVEGAELDVVRGARRLISQRQPTILIEVLEANQNRFGRTGQDVLAALRDFGYAFLSITDTGRLVPYNPQFANVLATARGH